jgi:hypothetical protein
MEFEFVEGKNQIEGRGLIGGMGRDEDEHDSVKQALFFNHIGIRHNEKTEADT